MIENYKPCRRHDLLVEMTDKEIDDAIKHGAKMRRTSIAHGHKNKHGYEPSDNMALRVQCLGSLAEAVVRKALDIDAPLTSETFNVPDFPNNIQVRLIGRDRYGLRIYPRDADGWKTIGVVIPKGYEREPPYRIPGWILAGDAKRQEWLMDPHNRGYPMWAVPQKHLRDIRELKT